MIKVSFVVCGLLLLIGSCNEAGENQNNEQAVQKENLSIDTVGTGLSSCEIDTSTIMRVDNLVGNELTYTAGYCNSNYGDTLVTMFNPLKWRLTVNQSDTIAIFVQFPPTVVLDSITKGFYLKGKDCQNSGMQFNFIFHESTIPGQTQTTTFKYLIDKTEWEAQEYFIVSFNDYKKKIESSKYTDEPTEKK